MKQLAEEENEELRKSLWEMSTNRLVEVAKEADKKRYLLGFLLLLIGCLFLGTTGLALFFVPVGIILSIYLFIRESRRAGLYMLALVVGSTLGFLQCFPRHPPIKKSGQMEAFANLLDIRACQEAYKGNYGIYLECKPSPPNGGTDSIPDPWIDAGGFTEIGFEPDGAVRYQYAVRVSENGLSFVAIARSDLDEDSHSSAYVVDASSATYPKAQKDTAGIYSDGDDY